VRLRHTALVLGLAGSLVASACSSGDNGTIQLITGEETDTFTETPVPTSLEIQTLDTSGNLTTIGSYALPTATIDLGSQNEGTVATIEVTGLANGTPVVFGASLPLLFGALASTTQPIFVQRVGEFARLPNPLSDDRQAPILGDVQGQYLFVGGGSLASIATTTQLYDFGAFAPLGAPPTLPFAPLSAVFEGTIAWLFGDGGTASYFDLSGQDATTTIPALPGASFADIAGGATVVGDNGVQFVVGATRTTGEPTTAVLEIDPNDTSNSNYPNGGPTWITLSAPRLGAAAAWVTGVGFVVVGGSPTAPGAEIVKSGATAGTALAYPPDPSTFAGATALSAQTVLVAGGLTSGGAGAARTIDLGCMTQCAPFPWATPFSVALASTQAFTMSATEAFVVGNELFTGATHAYTVTASTVTEVATKVPHANATAIWSPVGSIALVGGSDLIETFVVLSN
jgi:hypothetical protein